MNIIAAVVKKTTLPYLYKEEYENVNHSFCFVSGKQWSVDLYESRCRSRTTALLSWKKTNGLNRKLNRLVPLKSYSTAPAVQMSKKVKSISLTALLQAHESSWWVEKKRGLLPQIWYSLKSFPPLKCLFVILSPARESNHALLLEWLSEIDLLPEYHLLISVQQ